MCFLPCFSIVIMLHSSRGFRLCEIMLCSCWSSLASSLTHMGFCISCSNAARRVGLDRLVKK